MLAKPTAKATKVAQIKLLSSRLLPISNMPAPKITGIDIKKENFIALFSFKPRKSPAEIVLPEREMPGKIAITWAKPIQSASR